MTERPFTKETMLTSLKGCGLPVNSTFWSIFRNSGIIQEVSKGKYMFTSKDPIYVGVLKAIKTKYLELKHKYYKVHEEKKASMEVAEAQSEIPEDSVETAIESEIQAAIELLKKEGYQILAPIGVIYQRL